MLAISDPDRYARYSANRAGALREFIFWALLFGSVGGIAWAIRGTTGWGGIDGAIVPGMAYGLLWYWVCRCRGVDARGVALWLGLGIAIGGEWGYGQYTGWIRGTFETVDGLIPLNPAIGHLWFVLCGIAWGIPGGIALGWALSGSQSLHRWLVRIIVPLGAAMLGRMLIQAQPGWFFPNYSPELYTPVPGTTLPEATLFQMQPFMIGAWCVCIALIAISWVLSRNDDPIVRGIGCGVSILSAIYSICLILWMGWWLFRPEDGLGLFDGELDKHLGRTVYTNAQNAIVVAWGVGATTVAAAQRDKWTLAMGAIIGGGFGVGMVISALWCLGYVYAPDYIDWWKMWEIHAGFNLGVLYAVALYWALRQVDKHQRIDRDPLGEQTAEPAWTLGETWWRPLASAAGVMLVWAYLFFEDDLVAGILLGPLYLAAVCWVTLEANLNGVSGTVRDRQRSLSLVFSAFYFLFILFHGATTRLGVFLELYDENAVGQYEWPVQRIWLFLPAAVLIVSVTLYKTWQIAHRGISPLQTPLNRTSLHIGTLIMLCGLVGALSIWPSEIGVIYAAVLLVAMYAFLRLVFTDNDAKDDSAEATE
jgi:hypothetical protein